VSAARLFNVDIIDEQLIKIKTGHASDALLAYYKRVGESKLEKLTDVIACKSRKLESSTCTSTSAVSHGATLSESASGVTVSSGGGSST